MVDGRPTGETFSVPLPSGTELGVRRLADQEPGAGLWCSGFAHAEFDDRARPAFRGVPCPQSNRIRTGQQCRLCLHLDKFRPIHRAHRGAALHEVARAYVSLPHWLYVATFPDGTSKVGTAHERSKVKRLDQQAVARASYVAHADDGFAVRRLEDAVTRTAELTQSKRVSSKYKAWLRPKDANELARIHDEVAGRARRNLESWEDTDFTVVDEAWEPGDVMLPAYERLRAAPSEPWVGDDAWFENPRRLRILSGAGPFLTARSDASDGAVESLLSTAGVKNRACVAVSGEEASSVQDALF